VKTVDGRSVGELVAAGRGKLSDAARARVVELGIPIDGALADTYPAAAWAACVQLMAADLFPAHDAIEAQRRLAQLRIDEFAARWRGRIVFALSRLAGRERSLARFVHGLRAAAPYLDTRFTVVGPRRYEAWVSDVTGVPGFFWGMIEGGARHFGVTEPIAIAAQDGDACTYAIGTNP